MGVKMKKIFIVLGMHRSATSLTAGLLFSYGMYAGNEKDLLEANKSNPKGFFENKKIFLLNEIILYGYGMYNWKYVANKINLVRYTNYKNEIKYILNDLCSKSKKEQDIFIKDPRMCLLEPVWRNEIDMLGLEENIIIVFRHPFEVAKSLQQRDNMNFSYALKLWFYYNLSLLFCIADRNIPVLFLNHEKYFNERKEQIRKIEKFIGRDNSKEDLVDIALWHNYALDMNITINEELKNIVLELYEYLLVLSDKNKTLVSKEDLKLYELYLEKIVITSYEKDNKDMFYADFKDATGREKKLLSLYKLQDKKCILVSKFKDYFNKYNIKKLYIYGNGSITKELLPILKELEIKIEKIFDKNQKDYVLDLEDIEPGIYIINTAINYGNSIHKNLSKYFGNKYILDIYELLNNVL